MPYATLLDELRYKSMCCSFEALLISSGTYWPIHFAIWESNILIVTLTLRDKTRMKNTVSR